MNVRRLLAPALLVSAFLPAVAASAQGPPSIEPGTLVRIRLSAEPPAVRRGAPEELRGEVVALDPDSLTLRIHPGVAPVAVAWPAVRRLDESRGRVTRLQAALLAGGAGALLGGAEWAFLNETVRDPSFESSSRAALVGASVGALGGAALGALRPWTRWRRIPLARPPVRDDGGR